MTVYQDFFHYHDGIYRHTRHGDNMLHGQHSVRIVGWGEEHGDKYWVSPYVWSEQDLSYYMKIELNIVYLNV